MQGGEDLRAVRVGECGALGVTLTSVATGGRPSRTVTSTSPAGVVKRSTPGPWRSPQATPVAIVACPQNGTSASGEK